jgi:hypothetical protein
VPQAASRDGEKRAEFGEIGFCSWRGTVSFAPVPHESHSVARLLRGLNYTMARDRTPGRVDDRVPLAVEGVEQLLMKTPYPTLLSPASFSSASSKYALSIQSSL